MKANMSAFDYADRSVGKYETRLDGLNKKLEVQRKVTEESRRHYEKMVEEHGRGSVEAEKAERAYLNQAAALNNLERYVENATEELEKMRKEQAYLESGWGRLTTGLEKFSGGMKRAGETLTNVGRTLSTRVTAPIVGLGTAAIAAADKVEKAYREIRIGTGATGEALEGLKNSFHVVFSQVPDDAEAVATALANLNTYTGWAGEALERLTLSVLDASRTMGEDGVAASTAFGKVLNAWNIEAEDAEAHLDHLYNLSQTYGVGIAELSGLITRQGTVLKNAGFEMGEVAHFMATLEANGLAVSRIMPGLNRATRNWADEGKNAKEELDKVIKSMKNAKTETEALTIASEVFGAQGAQRMVDAVRNDALPAIEDLGKMFEDSTGIISEATKDTRTLGEEFQILKNNTMVALEPFGRILIDLGKEYLPPVIEGVTKLAEWFNELDDNTKKTILSTLGITAAAGPASLALGGIFNVVGNLAGGVSKVTGLIGRGSVGLLGRFALMGASAGPVGLALGTVTALAGGIYLLHRRSQRLHDINYDLIDSVNDEIQTIKDLEERFTELYHKNRLTTDETLRYMDILSELEKADSEEAIKRLTKEQEELLEKSGLTNEEMEEFLEINNKIVDTTPNVTSAISDQGNAFVDNLDILKELNAEKVQSLMLDAQRELEKALENENSLLEKQIELEKEIEDIQKRIKETQQERLDLADELIIEQENQRKKDEEIKQLKEEIETLEGDALHKAEMRLALLKLEKAEQDGLVDTIIHEKDAADKLFDKLRKNLDEKIESLDTTKEELDNIKVMISDYEQLVLKQVGLNSARGDGVYALQDEIDKIKEQQRELQKANDLTEGGIAHLDDQILRLDQQKERLERAQKELQEINRLAGKTVYKDTILRMNPPIESINSLLEKPINKEIRLQGYDFYATYAHGTSNHPGGPAVLGDGVGSNAGSELVSLPDGKLFLSADQPTLYPHLPRGTEVLSARKTRNLLRAIPRYAEGVGRSSFNRLLAMFGRNERIDVESTSSISDNYDRELLNAILEQNRILLQLLKKESKVYLDARETSEVLEPHISEIQERQERVRSEYA